MKIQLSKARKIELRSVMYVVIENKRLQGQGIQVAQTFQYSKS
jgi:hypothetical protein